MKIQRTSMIPFKDLSIKSKITAIIMLTSCLALVSACVVFAVYEWVSVRRTMVQELATLADLTGRNCAVALTFNRADDAERWLMNLRADKHITAAGIYKEGALWAAYRPQPGDALPLKVATVGHRFTRNALEMSVPVQEPDAGVIATIFLRSNLDKLYSRLRQYVFLVAAVLLVASVVALFVSGKLQGRISRPILALSETARVVSEKRDYAVRAKAEGNDEVGLLIDSFNDMLGQIQIRETDLRAARDTANQANQAKSNFLSFMSHELRTPLTSIIGFSEVLLTEVAAEKRAAWADDLRRINDSGKYLLELINDILDLSKIEAGKMEVHLENFSVPAMVRDVTDVLSPLVAKRSNRLVVTCPNDIGSMQGDRIKVRQCLLNLLSNADKFTESGVVTLRVRREIRAGPEEMVFEVQDTGIGMTSEQMGKLFRAFTQADSSASRKHRGTGLGLALTKQFCQMMGGTVDVQSEPGHGSTFTIRLPVAMPRPSGAVQVSATPLPARPTEPGGDCILVVDDDPAVHRLLENALRSEGYRLAFARNGPEGLRLAKELKPAVITLDVIMPEMDGWVVLSLLKADPELAAIPVIMLTVCAEQDFAFSMGVADYLKKPIDRNRLVAVLHKYHREQTPVQVLVVEDDPAMRDMLRRVLEKEHWVVAEAENGLAALESITRHQPSLIILDMLMPVMDGFQMVAELQKHEEWRKIPVVVVSAKDLTAEDRLRLQSYVTAILQKGSFGREQLVREVQETVKAILPDQNLVES